MRRLALIVPLVAACPEGPRPIPRAKVELPAMELRMRPPAGKRAYDVRVWERLSVVRRGDGPGGLNVDLRLTMRVEREDAPAGDGFVTRLRIARVEADPRGPMAAVAAKAARAVEGALCTFEVDGRGRVRGFAVEGPAPARTLAERLAKTFLQMAPTLGEGLKGPGTRWGESSSVPLDIGEGGPVSASFTASYVLQGTGEVGTRPCVLLHAQIQSTGKAAATGARPGAVNVSGTGRGEMCLEPETGMLRAGNLEVTLRTGVALRRGRKAPLDLEQTLQLRLEAREAGGPA
jgi:hypothetical protein